MSEVELDQSVVKLSESEFNGKNSSIPFTGFVLFYADWCGYCQKLKPVWNELSKQKLFVVAAVDCTSGNKELSQLFEIQGFPSVHCFKNGMYIGEYKGDRDLESYKSFAERNFANDTPEPKKEVTPKKSRINVYILSFICVLILIGVLGFFMIPKKN